MNIADEVLSYKAEKKDIRFVFDAKESTKNAGDIKGPAGEKPIPAHFL